VTVSTERIGVGVHVSVDELNVVAVWDLVSIEVCENKNNWLVIKTRLVLFCTKAIGDRTEMDEAEVEEEEDGDEVDVRVTIVVVLAPPVAVLCYHYRKSKSI
jgi:hypothetical protein